MKKVTKLKICVFIVIVCTFCTWFLWLPNTSSKIAEQIIQSNDLEELSLLRPTTINFNEEDSKILTSGFSGVEKWGRWSDGEKAAIKFKLKNIEHNVFLQIDGYPFSEKGHKDQKVNIYANGNYLKTWEFSEGKPSPSMSLEVKKEYIVNNFLEIEFEILNPISPKDLNLSNDTRKLGIGIKSIIISQDRKIKGDMAELIPTTAKIIISGKTIKKKPAFSIFLNGQEISADLITLLAEKKEFFAVLEIVGTEADIDIKGQAYQNFILTLSKPEKQPEEDLEYILFEENNFSVIIPRMPYIPTINEPFEYQGQIGNTKECHVHIRWSKVIE